MKKLRWQQLLLVILHHAFSAVASQPVFVTQPQSLNISEGGSAVFTCIGTPQNVGQLWRINGLGLHEHDHRNTVHHPSETLPGGKRRTMLIVPGLAINDNISIECLLVVATSQPPQVNISNPVYLRVQGKLGNVQNVQLMQLNGSTLQLSYTPPFTLVGVPINFFTITITSLDQATNVTINTTDTELLYSPPNTCTDYLLQLSAWNSVGGGELYHINGTLYRAPLKPIGHSTVSFLTTSLISTVVFNIDTQCSGTQPENITITLKNDESLETAMLYSCPIRKHSIHCGNLLSISKTNTVALVTVNLSDYLTFSNHYTAVIGLVNKGGATESNFTINTFHVQKVSTRVFPGGHCVTCTCTFAAGTTAAGCHIRFNDTTGRQVKEAVAYRPEGSLLANDCVEDLPPGVYRVLAYDISSSGVVDGRVAAVGESLVTVIEKIPFTATSTHLTHSKHPSLKATVSISTTSTFEAHSHPSTSATVLTGAGSTKATQAADTTLLLSLIAAVTGISVLAAGVMIIMVACLVRYRAKARRHKIAEINAKRKQKELEEAAAQSGNDYPSPHLLPADPLYDEISANNKHVFATQPCPAYAPLPPPRV